MVRIPVYLKGDPEKCSKRVCRNGAWGPCPAAVSGYLNNRPVCTNHALEHIINRGGGHISV